MRNKFEPNEPHHAVRWFLDRLIPEDAHRVRVKVYLRKMKKQQGTCWAFKNQPTEFVIVINSALGRRATLTALAHESVHIMQYITGKIKDIYNEKGVVKNVVWKQSMLFEHSYVGEAYKNSPWEKEARAMQDRLAKAYLRHRRKHNS